MAVWPVSLLCLFNHVAKIFKSAGRQTTARPAASHCPARGPCRAQPVLISSFCLSSSFFFFPGLFSVVRDWMSTIIPHTWCGLSANLEECMSAKCCTRLTENTGRKKSPSQQHRTTLSGCIFTTKAWVDNWKKHSSTFSTCPHSILNFSPLTAQIGW